MGEPQVVPNDPTLSAFYGMLTGGCGKFLMPPGCTTAPCGGNETNRQIVKTWIESDAARN